MTRHQPLYAASASRDARTSPSPAATLPNQAASAVEEPDIDVAVLIGAEIGKDCDDFTQPVWQSLAEPQRKAIWERVMAALARSKRNCRWASDARPAEAQTALCSRCAA